MKPQLIAALLISALVFCGCAGQYSSINRDGATAEIIVGSSDDLLSALSEAMEENFMVDYHNLNSEAGRLFFRGVGTDRSLRGDVAVTVVLKQVSGKTSNGEDITGYSLTMTSIGVGPDASMFPDYATNNIYKALVTKLSDYRLSLVHIRNPKVERFSPTDDEEKTH
jgi:hypothetical protein